MERLIQILLLNAPAAIASVQPAGSVEGLVLGLDEAGTLWTGTLSGTGRAWSVQWTEVADQARAEREVVLKAQAAREADQIVEADKRRP